MNLTEKLSTITIANGYPVCPSEVINADDGRKPGVRGVAVSDDGTIRINADGRTLDAIKAAILSLVPDAKFADEKPAVKPLSPKLKEPADATAKKS